jgi:hypothetical protein
MSMPAQGHENRDINTWKVATVSIAILGALLLVGHYGPYFIFTYTARKVRSEAPAASPLYRPNELPPEPRLQTHAPQDLENVRNAEDRRLSSYGWVDRPNGVVHIPIERAIGIVAGRQTASPVSSDAARGEGQPKAATNQTEPERPGKAPASGGPK